MAGSLRALRRPARAFKFLVAAAALGVLTQAHYVGEGFSVAARAPRFCKIVTYFAIKQLSGARARVIAKTSTRVKRVQIFSNNPPTSESARRAALSFETSDGIIKTALESLATSYDKPLLKRPIKFFLKVSGK